MIGIISFIISFAIVLVFIWLLERLVVAAERIARALEDKKP